MPNPTGRNQLYEPEPKYGDVKKATQLKGEAPMSGAPIATPAVNAPQTAQRRATGGSQSAPKPQGAKGGPPPYPIEVAATWAEIANTPGASPLVKQIAERAARGYQG